MQRLSLVFLSLLLLGSQSPLPGDAIEQSDPSLAGIWRLVDTKSPDGLATPRDQVKTLNYLMTFHRDGQLTCQIGGQSLTCTYHTDLGTMPCAIEMRTNAGLCRGIFMIKKGTLTICIAEPGHSRPRQFKVDKKNRAGILVLERVR